MTVAVRASWFSNLIQNQDFKLKNILVRFFLASFELPEHFLCVFFLQLELFPFETLVFLLLLGHRFTDQRQLFIGGLIQKMKKKNNFQDGFLRNVTIL